MVACLRGLPIALVGRTSCAYSLEAHATLCAAAAPLGGADAVTTVWLDKAPAGAEVWAALKTELKQATVPYVFVGGEFLGGCDDIKKLQVRGRAGQGMQRGGGWGGVSAGSCGLPAQAGVHLHNRVHHTALPCACVPGIAQPGSKRATALCDLAPPPFTHAGRRHPGPQALRHLGRQGRPRARAPQEGRRFRRCRQRRRRGGRQDGPGAGRHRL